ncbi:Uncharacterised protein [Bordetella pertussis]|nr:Uncharacterised protein [Bordetella pertussis]CFO17916.1 Uncharacterised protein [Bordetella pertussis]
MAYPARPAGCGRDLAGTVSRPLPVHRGGRRPGRRGLAERALDSAGRRGGARRTRATGPVRRPGPGLGRATGRPGRQRRQPGQRRQLAALRHDRGRQRGRLALPGGVPADRAGPDSHAAAVVGAALSRAAAVSRAAALDQRLARRAGPRARLHGAGHAGRRPAVRCTGWRLAGRPAAAVCHRPAALDHAGGNAMRHGDTHAADPGPAGQQRQRGPAAPPVA